MSDDFWRVHTPEQSGTDSDSDEENETKEEKKGLNWATHLSVPSALTVPTVEMKQIARVELTGNARSVQFMWLIPHAERPQAGKKYVFLSSIAADKKCTTSIQMVSGMLLLFGPIALVPYQHNTTGLTPEQIAELPEICTVFC